jgi:hypothetical protein
MRKVFNCACSFGSQDGFSILERSNLVVEPLDALDALLMFKVNVGSPVTQLIQFLLPTADVRPPLPN